MEQKDASLRKSALRLLNNFAAKKRLQLLTNAFRACQ